MMFELTPGCRVTFTWKGERRTGTVEMVSWDSDGNLSACGIRLDGRPSEGPTGRKYQSVQLRDATDIIEFW